MNNNLPTIKRPNISTLIHKLKNENNTNSMRTSFDSQKISPYANLKNNTCDYCLISNKNKNK